MMDWIVVPFNPVDQEQADAMTAILNYVACEQTDILVKMILEGEDVRKED